ncbi:HAMP domain-containing histidine kinase [Frankia sp. CNm7]|uniref:histidine kinase n=1 Tax=Frankia nepalensis TaxID=1836974 RepID=A0A937R846_9ACTN|nr:HAMP domain-containing sensor histidine kinase [Frankia nepalensis]MBL7496698.1 HAMP domain-containing histidine kinase [Frankia nepalensis]MBL7511072.1 HAMP domain-containing histidine kinase [Frankia nepalensis]MBL7516706.1 HAMP domain-containing histidine kinase [Frankia nepalensis]MBL7627438.1 HAMP domain-containing histidine kinase [Frankia nepalensis]
MKIRTRITVILAVSLMAAGSFTLMVNAIVLRNVPFQSQSSFQGDLFARLGISRDAVARHLQAHPEDLFSSKFDDKPLPNGQTVNGARRALQQQPLTDALAEARRWSLIGILVFLVGALAAAWGLSGSILRPIRKVTARARSVSASNLGERVAIGGPNDEVKELADTFDSMLDRISASFDAQRRYAAQVAHELRTPLATTRAEIGMLIDDTSDAETQKRLRTVRDAVDRGERLVSQLLILSRTDLRDLETSRFPLDELVGNVLGRVVEGPSFARLQVDVDLRTVEVECDRALLESLVRNLIDNSARHNRRDGWVNVTVAPGDGDQAAHLRVSNSVADPANDTTPAPGRPGIGLSIVNAVIQAHGGTIHWSRRPGEVTAHVQIPTQASELLHAATGRPGAVALPVDGEGRRTRRPSGIGL